MTAADLPADAPSVPPSAAAFESAAALRAAHLALLDELDRATQGQTGEVHEHDAVRALHAAIDAFLARGVAAGALIEEARERSDCQVLLDFWGSMLARAGLDQPAPRLAAFDAARLPTLDDQDCPYVGLESFRDATYFFGRERDSDTLVEQIRQAPLVVVLGASGSGKSSLVLAGALPRLRVETHAGGGPRWRVAPAFTPGDAVLQHLLEACAAVRQEDAAQTLPALPALREDPALLAAWLDAGGQAVVLTFDQFEEVFTLALPEDRELLARVLAAVLQSPRGHRVVLTMREEFRTAVTELRPFEPWLAAAWFQVSPMGYDALRAAVEKPAALAGLRFQPGVVDDLVKRMLGQPAALPLLQFTLQALWRTRDRNRITRAVYERLGDPLVALKNAADQFYADQAPEAQAEVRRVLLALVRIDDLLEAYRQPVRRAKLLAPGRANTGAVIDLLQAAGYVRVTAGRSPSADGAAARADDVVEIRHEALIRNWPRLVEWIDDERRARRQRLVLLQAAQHWAASGRPGNGLLTDWQLQEAQRLDGLSDVEREFVEASAQALDHANNERVRRAEAATEAARRQLRQEVRLRHRAMMLFGLAVMVIAGLSAWAWQLSRDRHEQADLERQLALQIAQYEALSSRAASLQEENDRMFARQVLQVVAAEPGRVPTAAPGVSDTAASGAATGGPAAGAAAAASAGRPPAAAESAVTVYLHISDERQRARANQIAAQLQRSGITVPGVQRVDPVRRSEVRYFREADARGAAQIAQLLSRTLGVDGVVPVLLRGYEAKVRSQQYELWFAADALDPAVAAPGAAVSPAPGRAPNPALTPAPAPGLAPVPAPAPAAASAAGLPPAAVAGNPPDNVVPAVPPASQPVPPAAAQATAQAVPQAVPQATPRAASPFTERQRVELLVYRLEHGQPARSANDLNRSLVAQREWAQSRALAMNIRSPLGLAVLYDSAQSLGVFRASFVRARNDPSAGSTADERAWLLDFLKGRERPAINPSVDKPHERQRLAELRRLIEAGQWDLAEERPAAP